MTTPSGHRGAGEVRLDDGGDQGRRRPAGADAPTHERAPVVLDPFAGSGTTGEAALLRGRRVILIERDHDYAEIARRRCEAAERGTDWRAPASQLGLFGARGVR